MVFKIIRKYVFVVGLFFLCDWFNEVFRIFFCCIGSVVVVRIKDVNCVFVRDKIWIICEVIYCVKINFILVCFGWVFCFVFNV